MGIYASGQTYEQLILHLLAHPLPEARSYATMILAELREVMPSFLDPRRSPGPRRRVGLLPRVARPAAGARWAQRLGLDEPGGDEADGRPLGPAAVGAGR